MGTIRLIKILKSKKTGNLHCPDCLNKLKERKAFNEKVLFCRTCKMYFAHPDREVF